LISSWKHDWPIRLSNLEECSADLAVTFSKGKGLGVANGSYMLLQSTHLGSASWYLQHANNHDGGSGVVQTSGDEHEANTYHSKLQGLHSLLMAILAICQFHNVLEGKVTICCDNDRALWLSDVKSQQVSSKTKHADLIQAIWKINAAIPIDVVFQEVAGHLDC
jgi:hypothetical protein